MTYANDGRLTTYVVMASVPAMGIAGAATSALVGDIIHYGGPAIEITRTQSGTHHTKGATIFTSHGTGGIFSASSTGSRGSGFNGFFSQVGGSSKQAHGTIAALGVNWGESVSGYKVGAYKGLVEMYEFDELVNISNFKGHETAMVALHSSAIDSKSHHSTEVGAWASGFEEGVESRGYAAFALWSQDMDTPDYGWLDIGWDGDVLTIYDWALNTDGEIRVGQTMAAVPGATGLAALAMGAAGMRRRRKRVA